MLFTTTAQPTALAEAGTSYSQIAVRIGNSFILLEMNNAVEMMFPLKLISRCLGSHVDSRQNFQTKLPDRNFQTRASRKELPDKSYQQRHLELGVRRSLFKTAKTQIPRIPYKPQQGKVPSIPQQPSSPPPHT
jgi:hypothetical protein